MMSTVWFKWACRLSGGKAAMLNLPPGPESVILLWEKGFKSSPSGKGHLPPWREQRQVSHLQPSTRHGEITTTCRSISAKLISIRAINRCQKPTGTKLILNTLWMVLAVGHRMLLVSRPGLDGRRCGRR